MKRAHLGYEYTSVNDNSRLSTKVINNNLIMEQLGKVFRNMKPIVPFDVQEFSAKRRPK
jgi:hypothetical protein